MRMTFDDHQRAKAQLTLRLLRGIASAWHFAVPTDALAPVAKSAVERQNPK